MNGFTLDPNSWGIFSTAQGIGADPSYDYPRSTDTVPSNAVQSMQPVDAAADNGGWSDFWRQTTQQLLGYAIVRDAARNRVPVPGGGALNYPGGSASFDERTGERTDAARPMGTLVLVALVAGAVFIAIKVAK